MRKLIVCNIMSLDGCYTGPGNDVMALSTDGAFDAVGRPGCSGSSTLASGTTRTTSSFSTRSAATRVESPARASS